MTSQLASVRAPNYDYLIKFLLIGDSGTGKSCLLLRFCDNTFTPSFITTVGIDFKIKTIEMNGKRVKLQIWDTAGQERFKTITNAYYRTAMGILIVYDVTDEKSFTNVYGWLKNVSQFAPEGILKVLVGNKQDNGEKRVISTEDGEKLARENGLEFFETSAKTGFNVESVFTTVAQTIKDKIDHNTLAAQGKKSANALNLEANGMFKGAAVSSFARGAAGGDKKDSCGHHSSAKCCSLA